MLLGHGNSMYDVVNIRFVYKPSKLWYPDFLKGTMSEYLNDHSNLLNQMPPRYLLYPEIKRY